MNSPAELPDFCRELKNQRAVCEEVLTLVQCEHAALRSASPSSSPAGARKMPGAAGHDARKKFLGQLTESLERLRSHRLAWMQLPGPLRQQQGEIHGLLRGNQDLIMKILLLDRENEQALLRQGLVPPRHLPPAARQRPQAVANLYQRSQRNSAVLARFANASREDTGA